MKICHITSVHDYRDTRITLKECLSLKKAGNEVHLIATAEKNMKYKGIQIHSVKPKIQSRIKRIMSSTNRFYEKALEIDADIYHFHDPELIPLGKKLIKKGKKVIYDVHEDVPRQIMTKSWIPNVFRKKVSQIFEIYENHSIKKFTGIITSTPHIRDRFSKKNKNVTDIKNYPLLNELYVQDSEISIDKKNHIVYVGGISEKRGIFTMLKAVENLKETTLMLAGSFSNQEVYETAKEMKEWSSVDYKGFVGREEIKKILNQSRIGLTVLHPMQSYKESLPIKMFEYMAVGLPVVASNFPLWEQIINNSHSGIIVNPESPEEIAKAIKWLLDNPKEANEMGIRGRMAVEREYNWEAESIRLIEFYYKIKEL